MKRVLILPLLAAMLAFPQALSAAETDAAAGVLFEEMPTSLVPVGQTAGVLLDAEGVVASDYSPFICEGTSVAPAKDAGIRKNDIIISVENTPTYDSETLTRIISESGGRELTLDVKRGEKELSLRITPMRDDESGEFRLGLLVRNGIAGIGTVTFYDPASGVFGALGHGIKAEGSAFGIDGGGIYGIELDGVTKSVAGKAGELRGRFTGISFGELFENNRTGVYGRLTDPAAASPGFSRKPLPVAGRGDVEIGEAYIMSEIDPGGKSSAYDITITSRPGGEGQRFKSISFTVTDKLLLEKTGGIVQGMSGSPIIQNGKIIGAVTHVVIDEPSKGYAIFIGDMLASIGSADSARSILTAA